MEERNVEEKKREFKANGVMLLICVIIVVLCVGGYLYSTRLNFLGKIVSIKNENKTATVEEPKNETEAIFTLENYPKVDCSTATIPMATGFMANFTATDEDKVKVVSSKTDGAYRNLIQGNADLILVVDPSEEDKKIASDAGVELVSYKVANEGFVFFTNTKNSVSNLSLEQIQKIYTGEITNWQEVGGQDQKIIAYQRPINSGSQTGMISLVMKDLKLMNAPTENIAGSMEDIIDLVADYDSNAGAIGYSYFYYAKSMYAKDEIKLLAVNGILPSKETVRNETYPIKTAYYIVIKKSDVNNQNVMKLVDAMLSTRGQKIVEEEGYVPVK